MEIIKEFLVNTFKFEPLATLVNIILAGLMSYVIKLVYIKYGTALSNRKHFANSFLLITICTALIISLIQSSIALSLGLVGALSIIRFRTAIKEPPGLSYIFLCVAIGLGFGANERLLTLAAGILILIIIIISAKFRKNKIEEAYNLTLKTKTLAVDDIVNTTSDYCRRVDLRRFDDTSNGLNVILFVEFDKYESLKSCTNKLKELDSGIEINFISTRTIG